MCGENLHMCMIIYSHKESSLSRVLFKPQILE